MEKNEVFGTFACQKDFWLNMNEVLILKRWLRQWREREYTIKSQYWHGSNLHIVMVQIGKDSRTC